MPNGHPSEPRLHLGHKLKQVGQSVQSLASRESLTELTTMLDFPRRIRKHPYRMLAAAVGTGFVLGGGLYSMAARRVLGLAFQFGLRIAAVPILKQQLSALMTGTNSHCNPIPTDNKQGDTP